MGKRNRKRYLFTSSVARECQAISTIARRQRKEEFLAQPQNNEPDPIGPRYNLRRSSAVVSVAEADSSPVSTARAKSTRQKAMNGKKNCEGSGSGISTSATTSDSTSPLPQLSTTTTSNTITADNKTPFYYPQNDTYDPHLFNNSYDSDLFCIPADFNGDRSTVVDSSHFSSPVLTSPYCSLSSVTVSDSPVFSKPMTPTSMAQLARQRSNYSPSSNASPYTGYTLASTISELHLSPPQYLKPQVQNDDENKQWFFAPAVQTPSGSDGNIHDNNNNNNNNNNTTNMDWLSLTVPDNLISQSDPNGFEFSPLPPITFAKTNTFGLLSTQLSLPITPQPDYGVNSTTFGVLFAEPPVFPQAFVLSTPDPIITSPSLTPSFLPHIEDV